MGEMVVLFLCFFAAVVCGRSVQNQESNSTREMPKELLSRMRELEKFNEEFKGFKSSLVELSAAFGPFHQSLTKNGAATAKSGEVRLTTPSTPQPPKTENPAFKSIRSCSDAMEILPSPRSAKQTIYPHGNSTSLEVLCDFETDGGGWTIIQTKSRGYRYEFNLPWAVYTQGFGSFNGSFWLGLENIRALTQNGDQELRIQLEDFEGEKRWAKYSSFSISGASDFYRLSIRGFDKNSTAGDSMTNPGVASVNHGMRFTTKDEDNSSDPRLDCGALFGGGGGWWFSNCGASSLNGPYYEKGETVPYYHGILWKTWKGWRSSLAKAEMKIRTRKSP